MRVAVVGKGGAGKSVVAGTMARLLARRERPVLALDSDLMPGLELSLGAQTPTEPPLIEAAERGEDGRWHLKRGIGPVRAVRRFSTMAPDGVRLLQCGKLTAEGMPPIMGAVRAYYEVIHRLPRAKGLSDWALVGDLPAGPRQTAFDWAPYAETFMLVVEPTWQSALTARRIAKIARARGQARVLVLANKVEGERDVRRLEQLVGDPVYASVPADPAVAESDRAGTALIDEVAASPALEAIEGVVDRLATEGARGAAIPSST